MFVFNLASLYEFGHKRYIIWFYSFIHLFKRGIDFLQVTLVQICPDFSRCVYYSKEAILTQKIFSLYANIIFCVCVDKWMDGAAFVGCEWRLSGIETDESDNTGNMLLTNTNRI